MEGYLVVGSGELVIEDKVQKQVTVGSEGRLRQELMISGSGGEGTGHYIQAERYRFLGAESGDSEVLP